MELVDSAGRRALTQRGLDSRMAAGRPVFVSSPRRDAAPLAPAVQPSTPAEFQTIRALAPSLQNLDPRSIASFVAAPGVAAIPDVGGAGDPQILHVQALLAAWNGAYPGNCAPPNYGQNEAEFNGILNARTRSAVASFARWHNALPSATPADHLATTGTPDAPIYEALLRVGAFLAAHAAVPAPKPTAAATAKAGLLSGVSTGVGLAVAAAVAAYIFRDEVGL